VRSIAGIEFEAPEPDRIAARWAAIVERPVQDRGEGRRRIALDAGAIDFLPPSGGEEARTSVILEAAGETGATVDACGVRFRLA